MPQLTSFEDEAVTLRALELHDYRSCRERLCSMTMPERLLLIDNALSELQTAITQKHYHLILAHATTFNRLRTAAESLRIEQQRR